MIFLYVLVLLPLCVFLIGKAHAQSVPRIALNRSELKREDTDYKFRSALIITCWASDPKRIPIYERTISDWVSTGMDIFVVDSSGHFFDIEGIRGQTTFEQETPMNTTNGEVQSLDRCWRQWGEVLKDYDMVYKITGKYFLPDLPQLCIPQETHFLIQSKESPMPYINTEIMGMKPIYWYDFLHYNPGYVMEIRWYLFLKNKSDPKYRLPPLKVSVRCATTSGHVYDYL